VGNVEAAVKRIASECAKAEQFLRQDLEHYENDPSAGASRGMNTIKFETEKLEKAKNHRQALQVGLRTAMGGGRCMHIYHFSMYTCIACSGDCTAVHVRGSVRALV
jgi:hypothetical protein